LDVVDDGTVSVQIGAAPEVTGLHVGDSVRGPWWWGSITIAEIIPPGSDSPSSEPFTPPPCAPTPGPDASAPSPGVATPDPCMAVQGPVDGGGRVTVRWTPW
jgi:hypothetical protein